MKCSPTNTIRNTVMEYEENMNFIDDNHVPEWYGLVFGVKPGVMCFLQELPNPRIRIIIVVDERYALLQIDAL